MSLNQGTPTSVAYTCSPQHLWGYCDFLRRSADPEFLHAPGTSTKRVTPASISLRGLDARPTDLTACSHGPSRVAASKAFQSSVTPQAPAVHIGLDPGSEQQIKVMSSASEKLMVTMPAQHVVAIAGGQAELTCQLSPPRSAELMEIHWFRGDHSNPVYLYRGGREENGEADPEYVGRVEFVKETIGEGQVTLRINNISISDEGSYQCSFEDNGFSDMASLNLSVAAIGLDTQIHVQAPDNKGLLLECKSEGWYPQPKMEWRDSRGEEVPHSSISYSQDGAKLFHMKMTLLLQNKSQNSITCCIYNSLTAHEKKINIILANICV
ncbi:selection and upkeep of intraepithelial T-cells protein 8-like [Ochotona curzoniae]|uniref:selection and upkeep of intraepithelial T-cells protein 8-like n=1 Tax=Ochotona curzoniae TaxID=130825 RepID=UPI001B348DCC|nr:selection and upkeep of intraepithelial T-cells protein 8-like [Ochotona curzoniae]